MVGVSYDIISDAYDNEFSIGVVKANAEVF